MFWFLWGEWKKLLIQKICPIETVSNLVLDKHGNYVIQKALYYAETKERNIILNNIKLLIPKIMKESFGEQLLKRLYNNYPQLDDDKNEEKSIEINENLIIAWKIG